MKKILFLLINILYITAVYSQSSTNFTITNSVFDIGGGTSYTSNFILFDAIGQQGPTGYSSNSTMQLTSGLLGSYDVLTDVKKEEQLPTEYKLFQNYPNPFNPTTKIKYSIPVETLRATSPQYVTLKVYDILGNEVATLVNEEQPAGEYEINFDASKLTSGTYFYQLNTGEYSCTKKMLLIK